MPREVIRAWAFSKGRGHRHADLGKLPKDKLDLIIQAADEVTRASWTNIFRFGVWQPARHADEYERERVISNRAIEIAGGEMGSKTPVHPNDHSHVAIVERHFSHAIYIAAAERLTALIPEVQKVRDAIDAKAKSTRRC